MPKREVKILENIHHYNSNIESYDNTIYEKIESRFAHFVNFCNNSDIFCKWFNQRLSYYIDNCLHYGCVVDLGFSIPYPYIAIDSHKLDDSKTQFIFIDKEKSAKVFYNMFTTIPQLSSRKKNDVVICQDLDEDNAYQQIHEHILSIKPKSMLIVASEIIEHLKHPEKIWSFIKKVSKLPSLIETKVYITIPLGVTIPSHHSFYSTEKEALNYIQQYIKIDSYKNLSPPLSLGDIPYAQGCICISGTII